MVGCELDDNRCQTHVIVCECDKSLWVWVDACGCDCAQLYAEMCVHLRVPLELSPPPFDGRALLQQPSPPPAHSLTRPATRHRLNRRLEQDVYHELVRQPQCQITRLIIAMIAMCQITRLIIAMIAMRQITRSVL